MSTFVTPRLREMGQVTVSRGKQFAGFKDRQDGEWWLCPEIMHARWEIPEGADCWLEVSGRPLVGSYAIEFRRRESRIFGRFRTGLSCEFGFGVESGIAAAADQLGVTAEWKRWYIRLWIREKPC